MEEQAAGCQQGPCLRIPPSARCLISLEHSSQTPGSVPRTGPVLLWTERGLRAGLAGRAEFTLVAWEAGGH